MARKQMKRLRKSKRPSIARIIEQSKRKMKSKISTPVELIEDLEELKSSYQSLKEVETKVKKAKKEKKKMLK